MVLIKIWIISVKESSLLYSREFAVNIAKARRSDIKSIQLPSHEVEDDEFFVRKVFESIGLDTNDKSASIELSLEALGLEDEHEMKQFDFSSENQLPVVPVRLSDSHILWPLIIIEQNMHLFCGLPLIDNTSKQLIDHLNISCAFSTLQALIRHFFKESNLKLLEPFIAKHMPFGQLITWPAHLDGGTEGADRKSDDLLITIKVSESISSGSRDKELIYGCVRIQNSCALGTNAHLLMNLPQCDSLNLMFSPFCRRQQKQDIVQVDLTQAGSKHFYYLCDVTLFKPFMAYEYTVTRSSAHAFTYHLQLNITLNAGSNFKFTFFNVHFSQLATDETQIKVLNSTMTSGQLSWEKASLVWFIGNRFPKNRSISMEFDISGPNLDFSLSDTFVIFKTDGINYALPRIKTDAISVQNVVEKPKFLADFTMSAVNYKLVPSFQ